MANYIRKDSCIWYGKEPHPDLPQKGRRKTRWRITSEKIRALVATIFSSFENKDSCISGEHRIINKQSSLYYFQDIPCRQF